MNSRHGFTLLEIIIVMMVIIILTTITVPVMRSMRKNSAISKTKALIKNLESAMQAYEQFWGFYPPDPGGININSTGALFNAVSQPYAATVTRGRGPVKALFEPRSSDYIISGTNKIFVDAWGTPLVVYTANPTPLTHNNMDTCQIVSYGPDTVLDPQNMDGLDNNGNRFWDEPEELNDDIVNWGKTGGKA